MPTVAVVRIPGAPPSPDAARAAAASIEPVARLDAALVLAALAPPTACAVAAFAEARALLAQGHVVVVAGAEVSLDDGAVDALAAGARTTGLALVPTLGHDDDDDRAAARAVATGPWRDDVVALAPGGGGRAARFVVRRLTRDWLDEPDAPDPALAAVLAVAAVAVPPAPVAGPSGGVGLPPTGHAAAGTAASPDPAPLDPVARDLLRRAVARHVRDGEPLPPHPLDDPAGFRAWLADAETGEPGAVSRYVARLRERRDDLRRAFPEVPGRDAPGLTGWARGPGRADGPIPDDLVPPAPTAWPRATLPLPARPGERPGLNVAGFLTAELGIGEVARRVVHACDLGGVDAATFTYTRTKNRQAQPFRADDELRHGVNLVCVNADTLLAFARDVGPSFFAGRYTIGEWSWETASLPGAFHGAFEVVDEVWTHSDFMAAGIATAARRPVLVMPLPVVRPPVDAHLDRAALGLPAGVPLLLTSFDHRSVVARKNPAGAIAAFCRAFRPGEGPVLVVKSINGDRSEGAHEQLRALADGRADVVFRDGYLDAPANGALLAAADIFVSLHRSEGYGLNVADAVALGVPVLATRFGGVRSFATDDDVRYVGYRDVAVGPGNAPYEPSSTWAEPDLDEAAATLRDMVDRLDHERERAAAASERVRARFTPRRTAAWIAERLSALHA